MGVDDVGRGRPAMVDRAAAVRKALRRLVAAYGFHGASMSAVAKEAGVATGTAYVHYDSKDDLVRAAYRELKQEFSTAGAAAIDPQEPPEVRFRELWLACHRYLSEDPDRARFMMQVDSSPYGAALHSETPGLGEDPLLVEAARHDVKSQLLPVPTEVLYDLAIGPLLQLVASECLLEDAQLELVADACWRSITRS